MENLSNINLDSILLGVSRMSAYIISISHPQKIDDFLEGPTNTRQHFDGELK